MRRLLSTVAALALTASVAQAAPFTNGSFEISPLNPGAGFITLAAGNTQITGWTVDIHTIDYIGTYWQAADGSRSIDLSGDDAGAIFQFFDTTPGVQYRVQFALAGNPDGPPVNQTAFLDTTVGGPGVFTFLGAGTTRAAMGWTYFTFDLTATAISTGIRFRSGDPGFFGPALDDVSVSAIPEPASLFLLGSGLAMAARSVRRRARR